MTVESVLSILDENKKCTVYSFGKQLAHYDGKNSIPEELNDKKVGAVTFSADECLIFINELEV